ncbi:MAG: hypothetical protein IPL98_13180, partial [Saprospiraceae bacterium]|nr:hypothetical protein [Saprospiraceae bacterium]
MQGTSASYPNIAKSPATDTTNTRVDIDSTPDAVVDNDGTPVDDAINVQIKMITIQR